MGGHDKECGSSLPLLSAQKSADLPDGLFGRFRVQCHQQKYFASQLGRNSFIDSAVARDMVAGQAERPVSDHRVC
jgi:hypothetical protein